MKVVSNFKTEILTYNFSKGMGMRRQRYNLISQNYSKFTELKSSYKKFQGFLGYHLNFGLLSSLKLKFKSNSFLGGLGG